MQVLVCRPEKDAKKLANILKKEGLSAADFPTIKIYYRSIKESFKEYNSVIFTSKYAIDSLFRQYSPDLFVGKKIYSTGSGTANLLLKFGLIAKYPLRHNSEELLKLILEDGVYKNKFAIISGVSGNTLLADEISKYTACEKFELYERVFENLDKIVDKYNQLYFDGGPNIVVVTSLDIFKSFNRIFKKRHVHRDMIITITSSKMLKFVNDQGFYNTLRLDRLDNDYICEKILEIYRGKKCR